MTDLAWYDELRDRYRPAVVRLLLIGESPPDPRAGVRRFFYSPTLSYDNLYRGVAEALYGTEASFDVRAKVVNLERMRDDGVWLIDTVEAPVNASTLAERRRAIRSSVGGLVDRCQKIAPTVGVLLCHSVVFDESAEALREATVPVLHNIPLPFPLGNTRARFVVGARVALDNTQWRSRAALRETAHAHRARGPDVGNLLRERPRGGRK